MFILTCVIIFGHCRRTMWTSRCQTVLAQAQLTRVVWRPTTAPWESLLPPQGPTVKLPMGMKSHRFCTEPSKQVGSGSHSFTLQWFYFDLDISALTLFMSLCWLLCTLIFQCGLKIISICFLVVNSFSLMPPLSIIYVSMYSIKKDFHSYDHNFSVF